MSKQIEVGDVVWKDQGEHLMIVNEISDKLYCCIIDTIKVTSCSNPMDIPHWVLLDELTLISKGDFI
jgi:hypothetical protein